MRSEPRPYRSTWDEWTFGLAWLSAWSMSVLVLAIMVMMVPVATAGPSSIDGWERRVMSEAHGGLTTSLNGPIRLNPDDVEVWMYADCGDGSTNVARSDDRGETWSVVEVAAEASVFSCGLRFNPTDPDKVAMTYIDSTNFNLNVGVSTDGGLTWTVTEDVMTGFSFFTSAIVWADEDTVTAFGHDGNNHRVRASTSNDTGGTWESPRILFTLGSNDGPTRLFNQFNQLPDLPNTVWFFSEAGMAKSTDGGVTWPALEATGTTGACGFAGSDEEVMAMVTSQRWLVGVFESTESPSMCILETTDEASTWSVVRTDSLEGSQIDVSVDGSGAWGYAGNGSLVDRPLKMAWSEDQGASWTDVDVVSNADDCSGDRCDLQGLAVQFDGYVVAYGDRTSGDREVVFADVTAPAGPPPPGPTPVDFAKGLEDAVVSLGFRTAQSQMFFALAVVGIATVATGSALKWMSPGKTKNWLISAAAMGVGAFFVLIFFVELWMLIISIVIGGAVVAGPQSFVNNLAELKKEAERAVRGEPLPESMRVAGEEPGMVELPEDTEMVELPEDTEMVETTAMVELPEETEDVELPEETEDVEV